MVSVITHPRFTKVTKQSEAVNSKATKFNISGHGDAMPVVSHVIVLMRIRSLSVKLQNIHGRITKPMKK
jgi:hypothetical protein